ncbi:mitotic-spindle organizing protein 2 isoform X2 [Parasteatoda tepidariorum]|uniref:mitotic-spindle organizing protein 2 isoform X2 n=1 Tax=Parasteatoda tepidariorum TaxID=114398 RepID=UPI0039BC268F
MTEGRQQQTSKQHQFKKLADEDLELYQLAQLSGIIIDPHVFHILLELLRLDVCPIALFDVLQDMSMQFQKSSVKKSSDSKSSTTHTSSGKKKPPVAAKPKKIKNSYTERVTSVSTNFKSFVIFVSHSLMHILLDAETLQNNNLSYITGATSLNAQDICSQTAKETLFKW